MAKICIVCEENEAKYAIKDSREYYCEECAKESFNDISLLIKLEKEAKAIKKLIDSKIQEKDL